MVRPSAVPSVLQQVLAQLPLAASFRLTVLADRNSETAPAPSGAKATERVRPAPSPLRLSGAGLPSTGTRNEHLHRPSAMERACSFGTPCRGQLPVLSPVDRPDKLHHQCSALIRRSCTELSIFR